MYVSILVAPMDWGGSRPEDVQKVVESVAACFEGSASEAPVEPMLVFPTSDPEGVPHVVPERAGNRVRVHVTGHNREWNRLAYQFAHEFCHVLTNFRATEFYPWQWFDESICELASMFALRSMAASWSTSPPYPKWSEYAPKLGSYADSCIQMAEHTLPATEPFGPWLATTLPKLASHPYHREENTAIARRLLPLFEAEPDAWKAARHLNRWRTDTHAPLAEYFSGWRAVAPKQFRGIVDAIEQRLTTP